jgi:hypothetical protein
MPDESRAMMRSMIRTRVGVFFWIWGVPAIIALPAGTIFVALLGVAWPYAFTVAIIASTFVLGWGAWYFWLGPLRMWQPRTLTEAELADPTREARLTKMKRGVGLRSVVVWMAVVPVLFLLFWWVDMPLVAYLFFGVPAVIGLVSGVWLVYGSRRGS